MASEWSVQKALEEARHRVNTLEYLLEISRGVESRTRGETDDGGRGSCVVACER
jgi:hypothetical protein